MADTPVFIVVTPDDTKSRGADQAEDAPTGGNRGVPAPPYERGVPSAPRDEFRSGKQPRPSIRRPAVITLHDDHRRNGRRARRFCRASASGTPRWHRSFRSAVRPGPFLIRDHRSEQQPRRPAPPGRCSPGRLFRAEFDRRPVRTVGKAGTGRVGDRPHGKILCESINLVPGTDPALGIPIYHLPQQGQTRCQRGSDPERPDACTTTKLR